MEQDLAGPSDRLSGNADDMEVGDDSNEEAHFRYMPFSPRFAGYWKTMAGVSHRNEATLGKKF